MILILTLIAIKNMGSVFDFAKPKEVRKEEPPLPAFDPYITMQQNPSDSENLYEQEIQYTSVVDKKKGELINTILDDPENAARILISYIKD